MQGNALAALFMNIIDKNTLQSSQVIIDFDRARGQGIINILGDAFGAAIVARLSRSDFKDQQDGGEEENMELVKKTPNGNISYQDEQPVVTDV